MMLPRSTLLCSAMLVLALMSSCGGGSGGNEPPRNPCTDNPVVFISKVWDNNGVISQGLVGRVGVALKAVPTLTGNPPISDACKALQTFSTNPLRPLPVGLSLDPKTGVITGIPTQAFSSGGVPAYVTVLFPGYQPIDVLSGVNFTN